MKPEFLSDVALRIVAVGSRATCDPAPVGTDEDWLVAVKEGELQRAINLLGTAGFQLDNPNEHYRPEEGVFNSWRYEDVNVILTSDLCFYRRFLAASSVAKRLNLLEKADRVALFQAVLYGNGEFNDQENNDHGPFDW